MCKCHFCIWGGGGGLKTFFKFSDEGIYQNMETFILPISLKLTFWKLNWVFLICGG